MNSVTLLGRLTADPEIKDLGGDSRLARFTLAVNREFRTNGQETSDFIRCTCFGRTAQLAERYFHKGMLICCRGWIETGKYTNKDGRTVFTTDVRVERAEFAESKKDYDNRMELEASGEHIGIHEISDTKASPSREEQEAAHRPTEEFMKIPDDFDEDNIPFS